ncbi:MAG: hypothetical protein KQI35_15640 [Bacteroidetes bacterium]|nr:hypothetical protein [Bacteroidota bacterium]
MSCRKEFEKGDPPTFELIQDSGFIGGSASIPAGSLMKFKVHARQGSEKITNFYIEVRDPVAGSSYRLFDSAIFASEFIWTGSFYKSAAEIENWIFTLRDRVGQGNSSVFHFTTDTNSSYQPLTNIAGIVLGAQENTMFDGFYTIDDNIVYDGPQAMENQAFIDLIFYYGEDALTMASPGANIEEGIFDESFSPVNWEIRNTTRYIKTSLTQEDFNQTVNDSLMIALYIDADGKRKAKNLSVGDIYVFKNRQNRLGLFRISAASGTLDGMAKFDIKIQEANH